MPLFGWAVGFMFIVMLLVVISAVFWVIMIVDALTREDRRFPGKNKGSERLIWVIVLIFLNIVGAVMYYFLVKTKAPKK